MTSTHIDDRVRLRRAVTNGLAAKLLSQAIREAELIDQTIECPAAARDADEILDEVADRNREHVDTLRHLADVEADSWDLGTVVAVGLLILLTLVVGGAIGLAISIGGAV